MSKVRVKVCGITSLRDLSIAVEAGVDAVGFIVGVPESPRNLSMKEAEKLISRTPVFVETVVVSVPSSLKRLEEICRKLNPHSVQVYGLNRLNGHFREISHQTRLIGVVNVKPGLKVDEVVKDSREFDAVLLDSHLPGKYGGTGRTHDWSFSRQVRDAIYPKPLILAGGLTADNVEEAIRSVKPYAVDVSSGVESRPGVKDRKKVLEFVRKVRRVGEL